MFACLVGIALLRTSAVHVVEQQGEDREQTSHGELDPVTRDDTPDGKHGHQKWRETQGTTSLASQFPPSPRMLCSVKEHPARLPDAAHPTGSYPFALPRDGLPTPSAAKPLIAH